MKKTSNPDGVRYEWMTEAEQTAGIAFAAANEIGCDYGDRRDPAIKRNRWGLYIGLPYANESNPLTPEMIAAFEEAIGWEDPNA
jgi:hypothetical protein